MKNPKEVSKLILISQLGNTLVFLFYLIGSDGKAQKRLYEEVANLAPPRCDIAADDLRSAKYLRACITEAFRIIPTAPCIARILDEPIELSGYHLKAGVSTNPQTFTVNEIRRSFIKRQTKFQR